MIEISGLSAPYRHNNLASRGALPCHFHVLIHQPKASPQIPLSNQQYNQHKLPSTTPPNISKPPHRPWIFYTTRKSPEWIASTVTLVTQGSGRGSKETPMCFLRNPILGFSTHPVLIKRGNGNSLVFNLFKKLKIK